MSDAETIDMDMELIKSTLHRTYDENIFVKPPMYKSPEGRYWMKMVLPEGNKYIHDRGWKHVPMDAILPAWLQLGMLAYKLDKKVEGIPLFLGINTRQQFNKAVTDFSDLEVHVEHLVEELKQGTTYGSAHAEFYSKGEMITDAMLYYAFSTNPKIQEKKT